MRLVIAKVVASAALAVSVIAIATPHSVVAQGRVVSPIPINPTFERCQQLRSEYRDAAHATYETWNQCTSKSIQLSINSGRSDVGACPTRKIYSFASCCSELSEMDEARSQYDALNAACRNSKARKDANKSEWEKLVEADSRIVNGLDALETSRQIISDPVYAFKSMLKRTLQKEADYFLPDGSAPRRPSEMSFAIQWAINKSKSANDALRSPPVIGQIKASSLDVLGAIMEDAFAQHEKAWADFDKAVAQDRTLNRPNAFKPATKLNVAPPETDCSVLKNVDESRQLMMRDRAAYTSLMRECLK